jgi:hypothetical protein
VTGVDGSTVVREHEIADGRAMSNTIHKLRLVGLEGPLAEGEPLRGFERDPSDLTDNDLIREVARVGRGRRVCGQLQDMVVAGSHACWRRPDRP